LIRFGQAIAITPWDRRLIPWLSSNTLIFDLYTYEVNEMPKKVLLVDDSTTTLMMEEMILKQRTSYQCVTAKDGLDAISRAVVESPDLVLMDVVMPRMNGFEACKRMRLEASLRETPIILVTTRGEEEYVEAGFQSGCNDYITKPIDSFELVTLLHSYLGE